MQKRFLVVDQVKKNINAETNFKVAYGPPINLFRFQTLFLTLGIFW